MKALLDGRQGINYKPIITVSGSKSESNRLLLLKAIYPNISIENISVSDDTKILKDALSGIRDEIDVHHAGTAMRFLTAYFASKKGSIVTLRGSDRMHKRPIRILVEALQNLGAEIEYLGVEGYPPLKIFGKELSGGHVKVDANISSQYISALLLIAPALKKGLVVELIGDITSIPYIEMTLSLLRRIGVDCSFIDSIIRIKPKVDVDSSTVMVESDWSSASYFYSLVAMSENVELRLKSYSQSSLQGDSSLVSIYRSLGVETRFSTSGGTIILKKTKRSNINHISLDLRKTPDIAQTIVVTCFGMGMGCKLTGLHTLKIKESDRLSALKTELEKLGATVKITDDSIELYPSTPSINLNEKEPITLNTYQDHRMALSFAPLSLFFPIIIDDPMVVTKSVPDFWTVIQKMGVSVDFQ